MTDTDTAELVAKLRAQSEVPIDNNLDYIQGADALMSEAADRLTALERELGEARETLVGVSNAWEQRFNGERERGDAWMADARTAQAEVERLKEALGRQADNMAFVLNRVGYDVLHAWWDKFDRELTEDRAALQPQVGK